MHSLSTLAALAAITTNAMAGSNPFTVHYTRYHDLNCTQPFEGTIELAASKCHAFKHDDAHCSYSYDFLPSKEGDNPSVDGDCQVAAWSTTKCDRSAGWYSVGVAAPSFDAEGHGPCVSAPGGAHSAWVKCWKGPNHWPDWAKVHWRA